MISRRKGRLVNPMPVLGALTLAVVLFSGTAELPAEDEPWIITEPVVLTEPTDLGHVIVVSGGSLTVRDLPEPGLRMSGHIWAVGDGVVRARELGHPVHERLSRSVRARRRRRGADRGHRLRLSSSQRGSARPLGRRAMPRWWSRTPTSAMCSSFPPTRRASTARRLTGNFEVLVQDDSTMDARRHPAGPRPGQDLGLGRVPGRFRGRVLAAHARAISRAGLSSRDGATGIVQTATVTGARPFCGPCWCVKGSRVTLRDIPEEHWIVVGFHMPNDADVEGLVNDRFYADHTLDLDDREFRLVNASIDTWNLYPQADAHVTVRDSLLGEILSLENSRVRMERTTIDGTGGFFGARDTSRIIATDCRFTCTIEATQESTIELRSSSVEPYPADPTGAWTRFGAYDDGRLFADQTPVLTTPALAGRGLIAVSYVHEPPQSPPVGSVTLVGSIAQFSLDPEVAAGRGGSRLRTGTAVRRSSSAAEPNTSRTMSSGPGPMPNPRGRSPPPDHS